MVCGTWHRWSSCEEEDIGDLTKVCRYFQVPRNFLECARTPGWNFAQQVFACNAVQLMIQPRYLPGREQGKRLKR